MTPRFATFKFNENQPLTNQEVLHFAPSAGATAPQGAVSGKYQMYSTIELIDLMRADGWYPAFAQQSTVRLDENRGFQKHMIKMHHPDLKRADEYIEAVLTNSHNGRSAYMVMLGVFRLVCSNGLIVGETFEGIRIRHMHFTRDEIINASRQVIEMGPVIVRCMDDMKNTPLTENEKGAFAKSVLPLIYEDPAKSPIKPEQLLLPRRAADRGDDLWTTLNVVQENVLRGGLNGSNPTTQRRVTTRKVKSIDRDVKLNRSLWILAEEMKNLKQS